MQKPQLLLYQPTTMTRVLMRGKLGPRKQTRGGHVKTEAGIELMTHLQTKDSKADQQTAEVIREDGTRVLPQASRKHQAG